ELFHEVGIDPTYYFVHDTTADLPYDFYRPGEEKVREPIFLEMKNGKELELSRKSTIVDAITGRVQRDHKVYFPMERIIALQNCPAAIELKELLHIK
ncbi:MAG TPA: hypothetical protein VIR26_04230, partial [Metalysinibacillus sp.]